MSGDHRGRTVLTKGDLAKYPFVQEAAEYVRGLGLKIEELEGPDYRSILDRAEKRVQEALLNALVSAQLPKEDIEISSFPIAVMMAAATESPLIKGRYALSEAVRAYNFLKEETKEKILEVANNFNWRIRPLKEPQAYDFALHFTNFLKTAASFHADEWKLVNRVLLNGEVYLTRYEAARLLQEEVREHIEGKLDIRVGLLPQSVMDRVERLRSMHVEKREKIQFEELPKDVVNAAFPPCIKILYDRIKSGRRLSHLGRFTLTSFLLNTGMSVNEVVNLFRSLPDFNERMTRYQVEHIAGQKGSRTKYLSPRCDTLRTHGICPGMDETCRRRIRHPLTYYRRKLRAMRAKAPEEQEGKPEQT